MHLIKIGGNELNQNGFKSKLAHAIKTFVEPVIIVHGGGKEVDAVLTRFGLKPVKIQGIRRTDADALNVAVMVLCGLVSKQLVAALIDVGLDAVGLSGVDGGLLRVRKMKNPDYDLGFVGEIVSVRAEFLLTLVKRGATPVISPISLGLDGQIYNVNADQAASAIAQSLGVKRLDFVSDVPGVLIGGKVLPRLQASEAKRMIARGEIRDGMVPKVIASLETLHKGVSEVRIVDIAGLTNNSGTILVADQPNNA